MGAGAPASVRTSPFSATGSFASAGSPTHLPGTASTPRDGCRPRIHRCPQSQRRLVPPESCLQAKVTQGFTSEVLMADGISYAPVSRETVSQWMFYLRGLNGLRVSSTAAGRLSATICSRCTGATCKMRRLTCLTPTRALVAGFRQTTLDDYQMRQVRHEVRQSMEQGAVGLSTGSITSCNAMPRWRNWPKSAG